MLCNVATEVERWEINTSIYTVLYTAMLQRRRRLSVLIAVVLWSVTSAGDVGEF